ncbi:MAG: signal transduction histidine kinase/DNA-binding response OmpR family regulator [Flavobacteriales bacterium]
MFRKFAERSYNRSMAERLNLSKYYILFLSTVIALIIVSQVILHFSLKKQQHDSTQVNIATRQTELLTSIALKSKEIQDGDVSEPYNSAKELAVLYQKWKDSHRGLVNGSIAYQLSGDNSPEVKAMFNELTPEFIKLSKSVEQIMNAQKGEDISESVNTILNGDDEYLNLMKKISYQYVRESQDRVSSARMIGWVLTGLTVLALLFSFAMFIRPMFRRLSSQNEELISLNRDLEKTSKVKGDFLANMSHEIRTPLNGIIGMSGLLGKTKLGEEQEEYVQSIRKSSENLLVIVGDILDFSKIEAGKMELDPRSFDLNQCVDEVIDMLKPSTIEKKIELMYYIEPDVPPHLTLDSFRLKQVLINLLNNAIKFTDQGEVVLQIGVVNVDQGLMQLKFSIRDTGIGIKTDQVGLLFKSFSQVDSSNTRKYQGTGLGLAICKNIVNLMGGKIWVESQLGKGSDFQFTVICESSHVSPEDSMDVKLLRGLKALVVDDNTTNLKILVKQLANWGVQATPFNDPELVVDLITTLRKFDLCILDMQMPGIDGKELTKKIRAHYHETELPVIVLSSIGKSLLGDDEGLYSAYMTKPVKQKHLLTTIYKVMGLGAQSQAVETITTGNHIGSFGSSDLRILIAEDNEINQAVTAKTLEMLGYKSERAFNGNEVLDKINTRDFDLILMDVNMPEMDGMETTKKIRAMFHKEESPVIIGLSGVDGEDEKKKCLKIGMDDFLAKPLDMDELAIRLSHWFPPTA